MNIKELSTVSGKKVLKIVAIVIVVVALFILLGSVLKRQASGAWPMHDDYGQRKRVSYIEPESQYVFPYDARRTGKIALKIDDSNVFMQEVESVAGRESGEVVFYEMNNATSEMRSGTIVVRIADNKFEEVFAQLKNRGSLVVQESVSKQANDQIACPMVSPGSETVPAIIDEQDKSGSEQKSGDTDERNVASEDIASTISDSTASVYCPTADNSRNFSYIKVVFVNDNRQDDFFGANNNDDYLTGVNLQKMGKWILIVMAVKIAVTFFVIACLILLIVQFLRHTIFHHHRVRGHQVEEKKKNQTKPLRKENKVAVKRRSVVLKSRGKK